MQDQKTAVPDRPRRMALHTKILIGLIVGVVAGVAVNRSLGNEDERLIWIVSNITEPVGTLFIRLLLMTVIPLVFCSLIVGVAGVGDIRKIGRVGLKSFAYSFILSAISVGIGLGLANAIQPGKRVSEETKEALKAKYLPEASKVTEAAKKASTDSPFMQAVKAVVPSNPINSLAGETPNMLHLMFFALIIGIGVTLIPGEAARPIVDFLQGFYEVTAKIIQLVMRLAPYAVACLLFTSTARFGPELLTALAWFIITVLVGLALHMFVIYSLSVYFLSRLSPAEFFRRIKTVILTAFSTSSSNATLPTAIRVSEENLGVPPEINRFVLTIGATANQNGTALYEGVTVLFLTSLAGIELSIGQQLMIVYLAIIGGIGTAGVPSGSIPFVALILENIQPNLGIMVAIILGVDRILDMCRTVLNVVGDLTIATYVARSEGYDLLPDNKAK